MTKDKEIKTLKHSNKAHKGAIITLACLLGGATIAAVVAPVLVSIYKKGGGDTPEPTPTTTYTVTFDSNGGSAVPAQTIISGNKAAKPSCTWAEHKLEYWEYNGAQWNFETQAVTSNITLKAIWTDDPTIVLRTVTYHAHSAQSGQQGYFVDSEGERIEAESVAVKVESGQQLGSTSCAYEPRLDPISSVEYVFTEWTDSTGVRIQGSTIIDQDMEVYASYIVKSQNVTLTFQVGDGETLAGSSTRSVVKNETEWSTVKSNGLPTASKSGYTFKGWSLTPASEGEQEEVPDTTTFSQNTCLYPIYENSTFQKFVFHVINDTKHTQKLVVEGEEQTTDYTTTVDIAAASGSGQITWNQLFKPTVKEAGAGFVGWYQNYDKTQATTELQFTDKIVGTEQITLNPGGQYDLYCRMDVASKQPHLTFTIPDGKETEWSQYEWVGNTEFQTTTDEPDFDDIDKPAIYRNYIPERSAWAAYKSNYKVESWQIWKYNDAARTTSELIEGASAVKEGDHYLLSDPTGFGLRIIPNTVLKYNLDFYDKYDTKLDPIYYNDKDIWDEIPKPEVTALLDNQMFMGWTDQRSGETEILIDKNTLVSTLGTGKGTDISKIKPFYSDTYRQVDVVAKGVSSETSTAETGDVDVDYDGNILFGIPLKATNMSTLAKPLPTAGTASAPDPTYKYSEKWQYRYYDSQAATTGWGAWTLVTDATAELPAGVKDDKVELRPVLTKLCTVDFKIKDEDTGKGSLNHSSVYVETGTLGNVTPSVTELDSENYTFDHWEDKDGTTVTSSYEIRGDMTGENAIVAVFKSVQKTITFNFFAKTAERSHVSIDTQTFVYNHELWTSATQLSDIWSNITTPTAIKDAGKYNFKGWAMWVEDGSGGGEYELIQSCGGSYNPDILSLQNSSITLYADFDTTAQYCDVTILEDPTKYKVLSGQTVQFDKGTTFPLAEYMNNSRAVIVPVGDNIGHRPAGFQYQDGTNWKDITTTTEIQSDMIIKPVFNTEADKEYVAMTADAENTGCTGDVFTGQHQVEYGTPVSSAVGSLLGTPGLPDKTTFIEWRIKESDTSRRSITENDYAIDDFTMVPAVKGESEYKNGSKPYFYDTDKEQWATIESCSGASMSVWYSQETNPTTYDKSKFNFKVEFGTRMTSIPDNFMMGCSAWNNGSTTETPVDAPLQLPSLRDATGSGDLLIGNNFLSGCDSFNQEIDFSKSTECEVLTIGSNFMSNCYSFNQDIDFSVVTYGTSTTPPEILIGSDSSPSFMYECRSFISSLKLATDQYIKFSTSATSWAQEIDTNSFASYDSRCALVKTGFFVPNGSWLVDKSSTTAPYRTINETPAP